MRLQLHPISHKRRILPMHIGNYATFREEFGSEKDENELHILEKFYAARSISMDSKESFVDGTLYDPSNHSQKVTGDVIGVRDEELTVAFCETKPLRNELIKDLELVSESENSKAVVFYPSKVDAGPIQTRFKEAIKERKLRLQELSWRDRGLERAFRDVLALIDLLCNETRVKMLLPLLEKPQGKRYFREAINPKLIYENVPLLRMHKMIKELSDGLYDLTPIGKKILCEYLAFLENVKRLLGEE